MAMEVEDSKNDLEVGLDNDFLIFKPFIEVVQILLISHCPLLLGACLNPATGEKLIVI